MKRGFTLIELLEVIVCGSTDIIASNITYTPKDTSWAVSNVEVAIGSVKSSFLSRC